MKILIVAVCLSLFVASQAFILNDGFRDLAMLNVVQGRSPFDFSTLFGSSSAQASPAARTAASGQRTAGTGAAATSRGAVNPFNSWLGMSMIGDMGFF